MASGKDKRIWVGFDLGGTKMLSKVFDADFQCLGFERTKTRGHEGSDAGLERIVEEGWHGVLLRDPGPGSPESGLI